MAKRAAVIALLELLQSDSDNSSDGDCSDDDFTAVGATEFDWIFGVSETLSNAENRTDIAWTYTDEEVNRTWRMLRPVRCLWPPFCLGRCGQPLAR